MCEAYEGSGDHIMPAGSLLGATHRIGFVIVVLVLASVGQAAERLVPSQYATIQAAINAAAAGDVVIIAPGTYTGSGNRDVNLKGKAITVRSTNPDDPAVVAATVIDCQGTSASRHRGFKFITNEGPNSVLSGLTIRNGFGPNENWEGSANSAGGAIYISSASGTTSPTIRNCVIENCQGDYWGGGIYAWKSSSLIEGCTFRNCQEPGGMGGAIYCNANGLTITRCTFSGNSAAYGGALYCLSNTPVLANCLLVGNTAASAGGAMRLKNCTNPRVTNCTFSGNQGGGLGGAVHATACNGIAIGNCTLWADTATSGPEAVLDGACTMSVAYSDVQGGEASVYVEPGSTLTWDNGNIDSDPLFVDGDGPDNNPATWQDNDYHLQPTSPCINTGSNALAAIFTDTTTATGTATTIVVADAGKYSVDDEIECDGDGILRTVTAVDAATNTVVFDLALAGPSTIGKAIRDYGWGDIDGNDRVVLDAVDMGAYETIEFNLVHNITQDKWYTRIQDAIDAAASKDVIVVSPGTYTGPGNRDIDFKGKAITVRSSDPTNPNVVAATIIDCDDPTEIYRGFYLHSGEGPDSIIQGLVIANGWRGYNEPGGAGIYCEGASPTISYCTITHNTSEQGQGAASGVLAATRSSNTA